LKGLEHPVVTAFGATTIIVLTLMAPLVSPLHHELYHFCGPPSALILPVLLNFAAVWIMLALLLAVGLHFRWLDLCLWGILGVFLPWMFMQDCFSLTIGHMSRPANAVFLALFLVAVASLLAMRSRAATLFRHGSKFARVMLGIAAFNGALILAQILWSGWQSRRLDAPRPLHQPATASTNRGRIVWVVLDELSYLQIYERRDSSLKLPAFDRLASGATVFTHTVPAGYWTDVVLPSLMTGQPLDNIGAPAAGLPLLVRTASTRAWQPFSPRQTVFQDALNAGYQTAVAGWWNPYCRILSEVLDQCFWTNHNELRGGMHSSQSVISNTESPVLQMMPSHSSLRESNYFHQLDYRELLAAGDKLLNDRSATFVLLHLPIPHMPGIYNRRTASFAASNTSYLDNLALCDDYLAHIRKELEDNGTWDSTTLVLMGDHSWRLSRESAIAPEERVATSGGHFDDRPAYIVKLAHQNTPARIDTQFPALRTRDLFDNLLTGRINTTQQLTSWVQQGTQQGKQQGTQEGSQQGTQPHGI
jgi:Sulfatase